MNTARNRLHQSGFGMIEVLVTLIILLIGLLGLAGLMVQSQRSEMESYQRVQALILLQDMADRINANRKAAICYAISNVTGAPFLGTRSTLALPVPATQCTPAMINAVYPNLPAATTALAAQTAVLDLNAWHQALLGAAEKLNGNQTGAMVDARGCVAYDAAQELVDPISLAKIPGSGVYTISIAWQGLGGTFANTGLLCGAGQYPAPPALADETQRRVVGLSLRIAYLK